MKGCARSCLLWLLGWAAAAYAFYFYFAGLHDFGPPMYWGAAIAGLFVVISIGCAHGIMTTYRERTMLLEAVSGMPPPDGQWVAVSGTIRSTKPLRAPISGKEAVAYQYRVHRMEGSGKNRTDATHYEGKGLAQSTIVTRQGNVRLLAVPVLDVEPESISEAEAIANANAYIRQTTFETRATPKERRTGVEQESTDDDGFFRVDKKNTNHEGELNDTFRFEERCVKSGETVCAFGLYAQMRGGLVPHPNWGKQARLMRGDAANVAARLRRRMIHYGITILCLSVGVYAIVRFYHYQVDNLS